MVIQSYNHSIFKDYLDFDRNSILLNGEIPAELLTTIRMNSPESKITSYSGDIITQLGYSKNGHVNYFANLIGTTADFLSLPIPDNSCANNIVCTEIIHGRDLTAEDIKNASPVAVVSELTGQIFSGKKNPLGEKIKLVMNSNEQDILEVKIVGIYKNTPYDFKAIELINHSTTNCQQINHMIDIFLPHTVVAQFMASEQFFHSVVVYGFNQGSNLDLIHLLIKLYQNTIQVFTYRSHIQLLKQINSNMQNMLFVATIALVCISGLTLMNSLLFLVKERVKEIGIKKSLGATLEYIIAEFFIEGLALCFFGAIIGTFLSVLLINHGKPLLEDMIGTKVFIIFNPEIVLAGFMLALLQGILFSIVPVIYASEIKIADALSQD